MADKKEKSQQHPKEKKTKPDPKQDEKQKPVIKQSHLFEMVIIKKPDNE